MQNDLVEIVADAIEPKFGTFAPGLRGGMALEFAQAALTALQSAGPTDAMVAAGVNAARPGAYDCAADYVTAIYTAMLQAARGGA